MPYLYPHFELIWGWMPSLSCCSAGLPMSRCRHKACLIGEGGRGARRGRGIQGTTTIATLVRQQFHFTNSNFNSNSKHLHDDHGNRIDNKNNNCLVLSHHQHRGYSIVGVAMLLVFSSASTLVDRDAQRAQCLAVHR